MKIYHIAIANILFILPLFVLPLYADFSATINKSVNVEKEQKITAKIDGEQKIIEGILKATPHLEKANVLVIDITWTNILDYKGRINVSALNSNIDIDTKFLNRGVSLLVRGNLPSNITLKTPEEKKEDKKRDITRTPSASNTNISTGMTSPVSDSVIDPNNLQKPDYIRTYDGCNQLYNQKEETIDAYQQIYYIDNDGVKKISQECSKTKTFPAKRQSCDIYHDFSHSVSYKRYQPFFEEDDKTYGAGGCVPMDALPHKIDYNACSAVAVGASFVKQGQWYFEESNGQKIYISPCVLDPYNESKDLLIKFEGCPVMHNIEQGQSKHLGKYYWVKPNNTIEFLGECVETKQSYFSHILSWNSNNGANVWQHVVQGDGVGYSQRVLTRYILIASEENRRIEINNKEVDATKYPHYAQQAGWAHYDDLNRGGVNGHSLKVFNTFVKYGSTAYNVGRQFSAERGNHIKVSFRNEGSEKCGGKLNPKSRFFYKDIIQRPDGSQYLTNRYDTGCN